MHVRPITLVRNENVPAAHCATGTSVTSHISHLPQFHVDHKRQIRSVNPPRLRRAISAAAADRALGGAIDIPPPSDAMLETCLCTAVAY